MMTFNQKMKCIASDFFIELKIADDNLEGTQMKPPFDQPILFTRLFDGKMGGELMETIDAIRENAVHVTA